MLAMADLVEAEGRLLRRNVLRTGLGLVLVAVAGLFAVIGAGLCLWAAYLGLLPRLGGAGAALLIGVVAWSLAGVLSWLAIRLAR